MESIEDLYGELANILNDKVSSSWDKIWFYTEIDEYETSVQFHYQDNETKGIIGSGEIPKKYGLDIEDYSNMLDSLVEIAERINKSINSESSNSWTTMTFVLDNEWNFETDFTYDSLDDTDWEDRKVLWSKKYLNV